MSDVFDLDAAALSDALAMAPAAEDQRFLVPKILGEE